MSYVLDNWSYDPFLLVVAATVALHELGLRNLARRSVPSRIRTRRRKSLLFYAGLAVLLLAVVSPIDYWADDYFFVHMFEHILIMFFAPILIVAGAPWLPLAFGFPVGLRRTVGRAVLLGSWSRPLRAVGRFFMNGTVAVVLFCVAMVLWHVPALFDAAANNQVIHIWLMHASFFVTGILFWLQIIPSHPIRPKLDDARSDLGDPRHQCGHDLDGDVAQHLYDDVVVCGLRPSPRRLALAVRRPADRCRDPVGVR